MLCHCPLCLTCNPETSHIYEPATHIRSEPCDDRRGIDEPRHVFFHHLENPFIQPHQLMFHLNPLLLDDILLVLDQAKPLLLPLLE